MMIHFVGVCDWNICGYDACDNKQQQCIATNTDIEPSPPSTASNIFVSLLCVYLFDCLQIHKYLQSI